VSAIFELAAISKDYRGLRPLRIHDLRVAAGERVALVRFDEVSAEVLVNLITGASLPDSGHVALFGRRTSEITDSTDWLSIVDRLGIVSERAVLLPGLSALQNLAIPFSLDVEPLEDEARDAAEALAREIELPPAAWHTAVGAADAAIQMRIRFGRALALGPEALLLEHASAKLRPSDAAQFAAVVARVAGGRGLAVLALGADETFARAVASRVLTWDPATGRLADRRRWLG